MKTDETKGTYKTGGGIIRVRKDSRYFTASNEPFIDKRLSWETRGLIGYLLTKPDNWQMRIGDLEQQGPAGNHKIRRMLAEARMYGYMNRVRVSREDGTFDWVTEIFESPSLNPTIGRLSTSGLSTSGKPRDIVITEEISTESRGIAKTDFQKIITELEMVCGGLNSSTTDLVKTWQEKHSLTWILKAISETKANGANSPKYTDKILIGWEAKGYPKTREEQVAERRKPSSTAKAPPSDDSFELELAEKRARLKAQVV